MCPSTTGTRLHCALNIRGQRLDARARKIAEDLLRLAFHLVFFAADVRNHIGVDVHGRDARIARARNRLHRGHHHAPDAELLQRSQRHHQHHGRAIRIRRRSALPSALASLLRQKLQMSALISGTSSGTSGIHAMIARVRNDRCAPRLRTPARFRSRRTHPSRKYQLRRLARLESETTMSRT